MEDLLSSDELLPYRVGGLLYAPALMEKAADKIIQRTYPYMNAVAFCLEDSVCDEALEQAEHQLKETLVRIQQACPAMNDRPLLFVRIRTPEHMHHVHQFLGAEESIITGYILPKFDLSNAGRYIRLIETYNQNRFQTLYIMPILESFSLADTTQRAANMTVLKELLDTVRPYVLNVRVGGNDFNHLYGLRRSVHQTIYDIGVIRDILIDIINVFEIDYVVSAAVWEHFGTNSQDAWATGLKREIELDLLNGFVGKTAIHPSQLPIIFNALKVSRTDYDDALNILNWQSKSYGVAKSADGSRMNEVKCHTKWAKRIKALGSIYGIREEE